MELYKVIPGTNYEASNLGNIRNAKTKQVLKPYLTKSGYCKVNLHGEGRSVHRLVVEAFIENADMDLTVNHKNGIKHDNSIENLEMVTQLENNRHARDVLGRAIWGTSRLHANKPRIKKINKGVSRWNVGKKKWRASIAIGGMKQKAKYFHQFEQAVAAYFNAHIERYGVEPSGEYINPDTGIAFSKAS